MDKALFAEKKTTNRNHPSGCLEHRYFDSRDDGMQVFARPDPEIPGAVILHPPCGGHYRQALDSPDIGPGTQRCTGPALARPPNEGDGQELRSKA